PAGRRPPRPFRYARIGFFSRLRGFRLIVSGGAGCLPWLIFVPKQENATEPRQEPEQAPLPVTPPRPRRGSRDQVARPLGPEVDHVGLDQREAVAIAADAAALVPGQPSGECDFAVAFEYRRVIEAGAA